MIRPAAEADVAALIELNNLHVPSVSPMDCASARWFLDNASVAVIGAGAGPLDALLVTLGPGTAYSSANYGWFGEHFERFLYVDRIVVAGHVEGRGLGRRLYGEVVEEARRGGFGQVCAEVNLQPRNDRSLRFHERFGFVEVGRRTDAEGKLLSMLRYLIPLG
jgi:hypothetical protein